MARDQLPWPRTGRLEFQVPVNIVPAMSDRAGSANRRQPVNRNSILSRGGRASASRSQIAISVTFGPAATCQDFQTGCSSQCAASGWAMAASVVASPSTAMAQAVTAWRAVLLTISAASRSSRAPACRIVPATDSGISRLAACTHATDSDSPNAGPHSIRHRRCFPPERNGTIRRWAGMAGPDSIRAYCRCGLLRHPRGGLHRGLRGDAPASRAPGDHWRSDDWSRRPAGVRQRP
jgi:hypothetical protein